MTSAWLAGQIDDLGHPGLDVYEFIDSAHAEEVSLEALQMGIRSLGDCKTGIQN